MRKLVAALLCAVLCLSFFALPAAAASTDDMTTDAAVLNMMGALQGDGNGSLKLDGTLTRAQFCKIAVIVMGLSDNVGQYANTTIYPDVRPSHWASGYINLAARSAGIITGYANGTFGPEDVITYGQTITILLRMLGYTAADVGPQWPESFVSKAAEIGLSYGVSLSADSPVTRGEAAALFVNLLNTYKKGTTTPYMQSIKNATVVDGVFLISSSTTTDAGEKGAVEISGAKTGKYLPVGEVPDALLGSYGTLVLNGEGKAFAFVPTRTGKTVTSTVSSVTSSTIKCTDWSTILPAASTTVYMNGTAAKYGTAWLSISAGMRVSAYYTDGGTLQCIIVFSVSSGNANIAVVMTDSYQLPATTTVYINGKPAKASDIIKYDVLAYDGAYKSCYVTRKALTGRFEDFEGSVKLPSKVTVFGMKFDVLDSAASTFAEFTLGATITLLLTSDNKVAGAVHSFKYPDMNYGIVESVSSASATVRLLSGFTVSGAVYGMSEGISKGSFVSVSSPKPGTISLYNLLDYSTYWPLDLKEGKLGINSLSGIVQVYDSVGGCNLKEIELSDIVGDTVEARKVLRALFDASGKVSLLVLDDVTGDAYTYGFIKTGTVTSVSGAEYPAIGVVNSNGTSDFGRGAHGLSPNDIGGIAVTGDGYLAGTVRLTAVKNVKRDSFQSHPDDQTYLKLPSGLMPVSDEVQVYLESTGVWTTLDKALAYSETFTVYYDRTPGTDAKVRVVVAH